MSRINKYMKELRKELIKNEVENQEEILEKYRKRYEFALEADIDEDEIEDMLGSPEEVANKYASEPEASKSFGEDEKNAEYKNDYNLIVKTVNDDILIKCSKDDKNHVFFEDIEKDNYNVTIDSEKGILIEYKKSKYLSLNRNSGTITISIPKNKVFDQINITGATSDLEAIDLEAQFIKLQTASGDIQLHQLKANNVYVNTVSGDAKIYKIFGNDVFLNTVSGDVEVEYVDARMLKIDSVSGDVDVNNCLGEYKTSAISGDVTVNGNACNTITKSIKGFFRK